MAELERQNQEPIDRSVEKAVERIEDAVEKAVDRIEDAVGGTLGDRLPGDPPKRKIPDEDEEDNQTTSVDPTP